MASREESVDVSIAAALAKIASLEKALEKATKATVDLNTTAAIAKVTSLGSALEKAMKGQTVTLNTAKAQAQIAALNRELGKVAAGRGSVDLAAVQKGRAAEVALAKSSAAAQTSASAQVAAAAESAAQRELNAARVKQTQLNAINRNISTFSQTQAAAADRVAEQVSAKSIARQRAVLSAQLSQVRSIQNVGQQLTFGLSLPIAAAGVAIAKLSFGFEDTINRIRVLTVPAFRASSKAVDDLRASILSLAGSTGRTPTELAEGFYQIASAGVAGSAALDVLKSAAQAATIGLGTTNVVADITTSVLNAFGDSAGNAFQVTNTLAEAVRLAKGEASDFAPVLGRLLPVAKNLGISFSDVAASVALLTRNGLSASEATTQLRGLFNSFIKPSVQARKELDRVGLSSTQLLQQLQAGDFIGALTRIRDAFGTDQLGLGRLFRNQQGLNAFLTLTRQLPATAKAFEDVAAAGKNATKEVSGFSLIKASPTVQFRVALAEVQAQLLKIGASLGPIIVQFTRFGVGILSFVNSLGSFGRTFFGIAAGLALVIGPAFLVFSAIRRLQIAEQQLAIAKGEVVAVTNAESTAFGSQAGAANRLFTVLRGGGGIVAKLGGALGALAAISIAPQLGQGLADAGSGAEKFGNALGIAGAAAGAFVAGSALGTPVLGGVAAAATLAAGAIGFFGEQAKNTTKVTENLRDALVGAQTAQQQLNVLVNQGALLKAVQGLLEGTDKLGQIELPDFADAGVNMNDYAKALTSGGAALKAFNKEAGNRIAVVQLANLNKELAANGNSFGQLSDEAKGLVNILRDVGAARLTHGQIGEITDQKKALDALSAAAEGNLTKLSNALGIPITKAAELTKLLGLTSDEIGATGDAAVAAEENLTGFGSAADGAALSIDDLHSSLTDAITAAEELNNVKLDTFTSQADQAAAFADLFETIAKNKGVLPTLGGQFDLTTEKGRLLAKANADVVDAVTKQIQGGEEAARALLTQAGGVDKATFAYTSFFNQLHDVATAAGLTEEQFTLLATQIGATPTQVFTDWGDAGVTAASKVSTAIDALLGAIPPQAADAVRAIKEPSDQVAALANQLSLLPPTTVANVVASVANGDTVGTLAEVIQDLPPTTQAAILATTSGLPDVQDLTDQIVNDLPPEKIANVLAQVTGTPAVENLHAAIAKIDPKKQAEIVANVHGKVEVDALNQSIGKTQSKTVTVTANVVGLTGVNGLFLGISKLVDKTVDVTTRFHTTGPGGTGLGNARGAFYGAGGVRHMAAGGYSRVPMIAHARQSRGILWAEPETMGEAYIPFSQRYRQRAKAILARTAGQFGMMVVPVQPRRAANGMILESRAAGGISAPLLNSLTRALNDRPATAGNRGPLIGAVEIAVPAQTPQAFAVQAVGALGARLAERMIDR